MLEENFLIPVADPQARVARWSTWREMVPMDLDLPKYKTTMLEAIGFRLRRNYVFIFAIVLGGWVVKVISQPTMVRSWRDLWSASPGTGCPPWLLLGGGLAFYLTLVVVMWYGRHIHAGEPEDEIAGLETNLAHWKR